jgi:hypothetical protein
MNLHECLLRPAEQRVAVGRDVGHFRADGDDEIRSLETGLQLTITNEPEMPDVGGMAVVEIILAPERCRDRHVKCACEIFDRALQSHAPARPADDDERPLGGSESLREVAHVVLRGCRGSQRRRRQDRGSALG